MECTEYYRIFVQVYRLIVRPLTDLLKKDIQEWSKATATTFDELKVAMSTTPILALLDISQEFFIEMNAYRNGTGDVLKQSSHPLAYMSKALDSTHSTISFYKKEILVIVSVVDKYRPYLIGGHFLIKTIINHSYTF